MGSTVEFKFLVVVDTANESESSPLSLSSDVEVAWCFCWVWVCFCVSIDYFFHQISQKQSSICSVCIWIRKHPTSNKRDLKWLKTLLRVKLNWKLNLSIYIYTSWTENSKSFAPNSKTQNSNWMSRTLHPLNFNSKLALSFCNSPRHGGYLKFHQGLHCVERVNLTLWKSIPKARGSGMFLWRRFSLLPSIHLVDVSSLLEPAFLSRLNSAKENRFVVG